MIDRKKTIAKIHIAKKQLGMDDDSFRSAIANGNLSRKSSLRACSDAELKTVLEHFVILGFKPNARKHGKKPHNYNRLPQYITKIEAMLADMGLSWEYADSIARNITGGKGGDYGGTGNQTLPGVEKLAWVKKDEHWRAIIAALHKEQRIRDRLCFIRQYQQNKGLDETQIEDLFKFAYQGPYKDWTRCDHGLGILCDYITQQLDWERSKQ